VDQTINCRQNDELFIFQKLSILSISDRLVHFWSFNIQMWTLATFTPEFIKTVRLWIYHWLLIKWSSFELNDQQWTNLLRHCRKNKQKQNGLFNHLDILDEKIVIFAFSRLLYRGFEKAILDLNFFFFCNDVMPRHRLVHCLLII